MKTERDRVGPPAETPCAACPWRTKNHGKPHPDGWYSDANRRRLWTGIRTGDAPGMTCHPTDPENQPVKDTTETRECAGVWLLIMREVHALESSAGLAAYRKGRKYALDRGGVGAVLEALLPRPLGRGLSGTTLSDEHVVSIGLGTGR